MQTERLNGYPMAQPADRGLFNQTKPPPETAAPSVVLLLIHDLFCSDGTRLERDEEHINALATDFQRLLKERPDQHPVQTPLRVIRRGDKYLIVAGNNRYFAGLRTPLRDMPCIVLPGDLDEAGLLIEQAKDNELHRGYTPLERARNVLRVAELRGCSQAEAGRLLGVSAADVSKLLRVLKDYPEQLHPLIGEGEGKVPITSAYQMARLKDVTTIKDLTDKVVKGLLKRDAVEGEVIKILGGGKKQPKGKSVKARTPKGVQLTLPPLDVDGLLAELGLVVEAIKRAQKNSLPMSSLPQLLRA